MYKLLSSLLELEYVGVPLNDDFSLNLPAMLESIEKNQPAVILLHGRIIQLGICLIRNQLRP
jgi:histidinol-phosphate aminotransferase